MPAEEGILNGRTIVVGVSGSIAAYKSAEIVSQCVQRGADVHVVMTPNAARFITPFTFQTLTRRRAMIDPFDPESVIDPTHISLTDAAELVLLAPATANLIAKIAHGIADDLLTSLLLAIKCPVLVAPAMNDRMYRNRVVQDNIRKLTALGYEFIDPEEGFLACGTYAVGRLADPFKVVAAIEKKLRRS